MLLVAASACTFDPGGGGSGPTTLGESGGEASTSESPLADTSTTGISDGDTTKGTGGHTSIGSITSPTTAMDADGGATTDPSDSTTGAEEASTGPETPPRLPGVWEACDPQGQCADGLTCIEYPDWNMCAKPCAHDLECAWNLWPVDCSTAFNGKGLCFVNCSDLVAVCPDGMQCMSVGGLVKRCGWPK